MEPDYFPDKARWQFIDVGKRHFQNPPSPLKIIFIIYLITIGFTNSLRRELISYYLCSSLRSSIPNLDRLSPISLSPQHGPPPLRCNFHNVTTNFSVFGFRMTSPLFCHLRPSKLKKRIYNCFTKYKETSLKAETRGRERRRGRIN